MVRVALRAILGIAVVSGFLAGEDGCLVSLVDRAILGMRGFEVSVVSLASLGFDLLPVLRVSRAVVGALLVRVHTKCTGLTREAPQPFAQIEALPSQ